MLFVIFFVFSPISWLVYLAILIAYFIPWKYLGLWIASVIAAWSIFLFPFNRRYVDPGHFDFLADPIINTINLILLIGITLVIIIRLFKRRKSKKNLRISQLVIFLSFGIYGILSAYFGYLFFTDFWHEYQPAWQAYSTIITATILTLIACLLCQKYIRISRSFSWIRNLYIFIYSLSISLILILVANLIFPITARQQAKKIIQAVGNGNTKHCIQSNRDEINSWLHLSPLTAWNKPNGNQGAGLRHAVLVVEKNKEYILYYWSYKLRKWEFTSVGFEPSAFTTPSDLECIPKTNYWNNLPFLFPE